MKVHKLRADEWGAARTEYLRNYRASRDEPRWSDAVTRLETGVALRRRTWSR